MAQSEVGGDTLVKEKHVVVDRDRQVLWLILVINVQPIVSCSHLLWVDSPHPQRDCSTDH